MHNRCHFFLMSPSQSTSLSLIPQPRDPSQELDPSLLILVYPNQPFFDSIQNGTQIFPLSNDSVLSETRSIRSGSAHFTLSQSKWIRNARHDTHNTRLESRINPLPWVTEGVSSIHSFSVPVKMKNAAKRAGCWFGAKLTWPLWVWVEVLSCSLDLAQLDSFVLTDRNNNNFFGVWGPTEVKEKCR